jgi:hypothetical protein
MGSIKGKEIKIELAIINEIDSFIDIANKRISSANEKVKNALVEYALAKSAGEKAMNLSKEAIVKAKDLGVDTKMFDGRYSLAKNSFDLASKNEQIKINY